jgi:hypothetical protein
MLPGNRIARATHPRQVKMECEGTYMAKSSDPRALVFSILAAALTWAGATAVALGPNVGTAALVSLMCLLVGVDSLLVAVWRTRQLASKANQ